MIDRASVLSIIIIILLSVYIISIYLLKINKNNFITNKVSW